MTDDNQLLHCTLREESCHWAFCKMLMKLHPEQMLEKDSDGNLPVHIITAAVETSDEDTFLCHDCLMKESKLVYAEFTNGDSNYCCETCLERESKKSIRHSFQIKPGTQCFFVKVTFLI